MKVSGVGTGAQVGGGKRVDKSDGKKGGFKKALVEAMDTMEEVHAVDTASGIGSVDAIFLAQSVGDDAEREARRRLIRHGEEMLDKLEELRHGLLLGIIPKEKLEQLAQSVRGRRETCADPRLGAILDEIELRAEVELAKLSR
jgi:hypothetical protein